MAANEWKVPRPSGVISSRDLARNTSKLLTELTESEHSLMIVRNGLPAAVISSIPDYRISKKGMEVLQALRIVDAEDRESAGN